MYDVDILISLCLIQTNVRVKNIVRSIDYQAKLFRRGKGTIGFGGFVVVIIRN